MKRLALLLILLAGTGCGLGGSMPYDSWRLGFLTPYNMEVWIETADVEDVNGRIFARAGSGTASVGYSRRLVGWPKSPSTGKGRHVVGAALPRRIYVRWQSLVEPQTYRVTLEIPERARELMLEEVPSPRPNTRYYNSAVAIGLAPGGIVKVWITGPVSDPVEVMCVQAEVEPLGPSQGKTNGEYAYTFEQLEPAMQEYLKTHKIPYDSWKCDEPSPTS